MFHMCMDYIYLDSHKNCQKGYDCNRCWSALHWGYMRWYKQDIKVRNFGHQGAHIRARQPPIGQQRSRGQLLHIYSFRPWIILKIDVFSLFASFFSSQFIEIQLSPWSPFFLAPRLSESEYYLYVDFDWIAAEHQGTYTYRYNVLRQDDSPLTIYYINSVHHKPRNPSLYTFSNGPTELFYRSDIMINDFLWKGPVLVRPSLLCRQPASGLYSLTWEVTRLCLGGFGALCYPPEETESGEVRALGLLYIV